VPPTPIPTVSSIQTTPTIPTAVNTVPVTPLVNNAAPKEVATEKPGYGVRLGNLADLKDQMREKLRQQSNDAPAPELDLEHIGIFWKEKALLLAKEKGTAAAGFLETTFSLDQLKITLHVNLALYDYLRTRRLDLLDFFKVKFRNEEINVVVEEKQINFEEQPMVASNREVFEEMAKKNPYLQQLKDRLRMDFDM
jgi:hypothetical protein